MLNVEMQTYTYIGSTIVQIYYTILADIVRHKGVLSLPKVNTKAGGGKETPYCSILDQLQAKSSHAHSTVILQIQMINSNFLQNYDNAVSSIQRRHKSYLLKQCSNL